MGTPYEELLIETNKVDVSTTNYSEYVAVGKDKDDNTMIAFIPAVSAFYNGHLEDHVRSMYLYFVKTTHPLISENNISLVYSSKLNPWRIPLIYTYYDILPPHLKSRIQAIYIIHPTIGTKINYNIYKIFFSKEYSYKTTFIPSISEFQRIHTPYKCLLPYTFIYQEDIDNGCQPSGNCIPLRIDYLNEKKTASIIYRCTTFLRQYGLHQVGLFRVAGNENVLSLVRMRLQPPIEMNIQDMLQYRKYIMIGANDEFYHSLYDMTTTVTYSSQGLSHHSHTYNQQHKHSVVVLTDIESIAQTLKLALRELPEPLFTFPAFERLIKTTKALENKEIELKAWHQEALRVIMKYMPDEHRFTLSHLLDFLREVAGQSHINQMDIKNLSIIFAPTLLRSASPDYTNPVTVFNEVRHCQLIVRHLLSIEKMYRVYGVHTLLTQSIADGTAVYGLDPITVLQGSSKEDMHLSIGLNRMITETTETTENNNSKSNFTSGIENKSRQYTLNTDAPTSLKYTVDDIDTNTTTVTTTNDMTTSPHFSSMQEWENIASETTTIESNMNTKMKNRVASYAHRYR